MKFLFAFFLLLSQISSSYAVDSTEFFSRYGLGTPSLDRYAASVKMSVDESCDYTLTFVFTHDEALPVPDDPSTQCNPANDPIILADDGEPYFADARWSYVELPDYMTNASGFEHVSLDFNPCGHPPIGSFSKPHYDIHFYRISTEYREEFMSCDVIPDLAPYVALCVPFEQTSDNGLGFFSLTNQALPNNPSGFTGPPDTAIAYMGAHAWLISETPSVAEWVEPITISGFHGEQTPAFFEVMVPLEFVTGDEDKTYSEDVTYLNQTITDLPYTYTMTYDGTSSKESTLVLKGKSNVCAEEFADLMNPSTSGVGVVGGMMMVGLVSGLMLVAVL